MTNFIYRRPLRPIIYTALAQVTFVVYLVIGTSIPQLLLQALSLRIKFS